MRSIFAAELPSLPKAVERMMTCLSEANPTSRLLALGCALIVSVTSCASNGDNEVTDMSEAPLVHLLAEGEVVFGIFSRSYDVDLATDFLFYSLESGPFDIPGMHVFVQSKRDSAGGAETHPLVLRIPPIRDGHDAARDHVREGLAAGAVSIVFPHVETMEEAELAVSAMGDESWPGNASGTLVNMLLIEDQVGVQNAREIVGVAGVSVVFPGPGDLRRAYDSDMDAVESAIQTVLAACKEFDVACGIRAGVDDIAERLEQGFRVIIVTEAAALEVGMEAAGRPTG